MNFLTQLLKKLFRVRATEDLVVGPAVPAGAFVHLHPRGRDVVAPLMTLPTQAEAVQFFEELGEFWIRLRDMTLSLNPLPDVSPNTKAWKKDALVGAVLHYTAGPTWKAAVRWFMDQTARASAHAVVARYRFGPMDDFELLKQLPVTVVQCVPPGRQALHASWANSFCYGIENVNLGRVTRSHADGDWQWWKGPVPDGRSIVACGSDGAFQIGYEPYTAGQLAANVILLRYLRVLRSLDRRLVLPHSAYQGKSARGKTKYDTGLLYPMARVRDLVFAETVSGKLTEAFQGDVEGDENGPEAYGDVPQDWKIGRDGPTESPPELDGEPERGQFVDDLQAMGYDVGPGSDDKSVRKALWVFQRSMGNKTPTGQIGGATRAQLTNRVQELAA